MENFFFFFSCSDQSSAAPSVQYALNNITTKVKQVTVSKFLFIWFTLIQVFEFDHLLG